MEHKAKEVKIGYIELSGKTIVSDPSHDRDVWRNATNIAVKPGKYAVFVTLSDEQTWGERVAYITAIHKDHMRSRNPVWKSYDADIDVDSGQCGIFDDTIYPQTAEACGSYDDESTFYGECCQLTLSEMQCGILKNRQPLP